MATSVEHFECTTWPEGPLCVACPAAARKTPGNGQSITSDLRQRLLQIFVDVIDMLDAE